jgi:hypothetical protein
MKNYQKAIAMAAILAVGFAIGIISNRSFTKIETKIVKSFVEEHLTARQRSWLGALEWCESRGGGLDTINLVDKDGTPSYYWYQFKPSTFKAYGEKYKLIPEGLTLGGTMLAMENYDTTLKIVATMISDPDVKWANEFPGCVKKLGAPPKD